jgi:hypothetical protein
MDQWVQLLLLFPPSTQTSNHLFQICCEPSHKNLTPSKTTNIQPIGKCCHESKTNCEGNDHIPKNINYIIMDTFVFTTRNIIKTISVHNRAIKTCTQIHSSTLVIDKAFIITCLFLLGLITVVIIETKE